MNMSLVTSWHADIIVLWLCFFKLLWGSQLSCWTSERFKYNMMESQIRSGHGRLRHDLHVKPFLEAARLFLHHINSLHQNLSNFRLEIYIRNKHWSINTVLGFIALKIGHMQIHPARKKPAGKEQQQTLKTAQSLGKIHQLLKHQC